MQIVDSRAAEPAECAISCLAEFARERGMTGMDVRDVWHAGLAAIAGRTPKAELPAWFPPALTPEQVAEYERVDRQVRAELASLPPA